MRGFRNLALFIPFFLIVFEIPSQSPYLSVELTEDLSLLGHAMLKRSDVPASSPEEWDDIQEQAVEVLLEEARWIFSGMIYGFYFHYVPGSASLEVEDSFELESLALIPRGDQALKVEKVGGDYNHITIQFSYWPDDLQKMRIARYRNSGYTATGGIGVMEMMEPEARMDAMKSAVKQALRANLRERYYNRPREVSGFLTFSHSPQMHIDAGAYNSSVRILYKIEDLKSYPSR